MKTYRGAGIAFFRQKDGQYEVFLGKRVMSAVEKFKTVTGSLADHILRWRSGFETRFSAAEAVNRGKCGDRQNNPRNRPTLW